MALVVACAPAAAEPPEAGRSAHAYRLVAVHGPGSVAALRARLGAAVFDEVLRLNRVDREHAPALDSLVLPEPAAGFRAPSPFPPALASLEAPPKLLVVSVRVQAFAAYDSGRLVRWGPLSTGAAGQPTRPGVYHANWKLPVHRSTVDSTWLMRWCVNIENRVGLALHQYALPGRPASHCCVRLSEADARWVYEWVDTWRLAADGTRVLANGTPVWITGAYDFDSPQPWRRLPADLDADRVRAPELERPVAAAPE
jgi:hypothetical protein